MRNTEFDTKLLIYRSRQVALMLWVLIMTLIFAFMIFRNGGEGYAWYVLAMPITGIGLSFLLFPPTEEWEYKAWQNKARRIEQQER